mmetsp:Transcript_12166/g.17540  ORF Transcript_12166/g.17540 Transcript_12166/m.17540 type:complete len:210 (-) Transcript_12166:248-877(-)
MIMSGKKVVYNMYCPSRSNKSGTRPLRKRAVEMVRTTNNAADISVIRSSRGIGCKSLIISSRVFVCLMPNIPLLIEFLLGKDFIVACSDPKLEMEPFCVHSDRVNFIIRTFPVVAAVSINAETDRGLALTRRAFISCSRFRGCSMTPRGDTADCTYESTAVFIVSVSLESLMVVPPLSKTLAHKPVSTASYLSVSSSAANAEESIKLSC